ncbi:prolyl oligopeptidase family serine peptidase [Oscillatoria laete-virens NRMC-F 0139]|nr:prolyl oligopeptidase family serine peptidase [Oscillatoria laete-virens]MDL5054815.1 prolyl oligopeptidase family serine peptidase [Oscillatoria laete-virens NRMC-F 0139]
MNSHNLGHNFFISLLAAGSLVAAPVSAGPQPLDLCKFNPARARAFMDAVPFKSAGNITVTFRPDGHEFAFVKDAAVTIGSVADGAIHATINAEASAAALGMPGASVEFGAINDRWQVEAQVADRAFLVPLDDLTRAAEQPQTGSPRLVRTMFPMANYDRREIASPDGAWLASLEGPDLAFRRATSAAKSVVTHESAAGRVWFLGNDIWEDSDTVWAPDSTRFIARLHDASAVPAIAMLDYLGPREEVRSFSYLARAGEPLPSTTLALVDVSTGTVTPLGTPSGPDKHLFFVEWAPDGASILALRYSRELREQEILSIDAATGAERVIYRRTAAQGWTKWPSGPRTVRHLPSGGYLLRSDHEGFFQYYVIGTNGAGLRRLTGGRVDVGDVIGIDPKRGLLYFLAPVSAERPYDQIPHRVALKGGRAIALSNQPGVHKSVLSPDGQTLATTYANEVQASATQLLRADGTVIATLASGTTPALIAGTPLPERVTVQTADPDLKMHGLLLKPAGFDPEKSHPVILRVYGGMQSRTAREGFWPEGLGWAGSEYYSMLNYLAASGFVVVMVSPPGTPGRGRDYNLVNHGSWPGRLPQHYVAGLQDLGRDRPWMDLARVGIDGNSWGGYTALYSALETPEAYRSVSISVPETDLLDHVHWIEWQLGTPAQNPEAFAKGGLQNRVTELRAQLLISAGTSDANVPVSNTMKLLDGLADAGKPYNLVLFPGTNHPHQGRGDRYAYAAEAIRAFHTRHLMEGMCR